MQLRNMYKVFKSYELDNPSQYDWFRKFSNPCYGMNVKVDVTEVVKTSKESGTSFFANVLFLLTTALNSVPEMRMREVKNEIRLYDVINPTFTVMTDSGKFVNAGFKMTNDYKEFYDTTRRIIDEKKKQTTFTAEYNDSSDYDDYYMTCLPWISVESLMHPLPDNNIESSSCPRIGWDKYREENGRYVMTLNITVSHCFVDGKRLSEYFAYRTPYYYLLASCGNLPEGKPHNFKNFKKRNKKPSHKRGFLFGKIIRVLPFRCILRNGYALLFRSLRRVLSRLRVSPLQAVHSGFRP